MNINKEFRVQNPRSIKGSNDKDKKLKMGIFTQLDEKCIVSYNLASYHFSGYNLIGEDVVLIPSQRPLKSEPQIEQIDFVSGYQVYIGNGTVCKATKIDNQVQIGENCVLENGCEIKKNVVLRNNSVVHSDVVLQSNWIQEGNPAVPVQQIPQNQIQKIKSVVIDKIEDKLENLDINLEEEKAQVKN